MIGWNIFRVSAMLLWRHFGDALRISLIPGVFVAFVSPLLMIWMYENVSFGGYSAGIPSEFAMILRLILNIAGALMMAYAAVAWHRFVLLSEKSSGIFPSPPVGTVSGYFGRTWLIGLIVFAFIFVFNWLIYTGIPLTIGYSIWTGIAVSLFVNAFASYIILRLGMILPARALENNHSLVSSWRATAKVGGPLVLSAILLSALKVLQLLPAVFNMPALISIVVGGAVTWLSLMVGISILTTLYGYCVEGRDLPA